MKALDTTVIVPVRNAREYLPALLAALRDQTEDCEILVTDTESRDGSREILDRFGVRVIDVAVSEFDHGLTRQRAAELSETPFVAFLSQDALPVGPNYLAQLLEPLRRDSRVAGVSARQTPRPDADPVTRHYVAGGPMGGDAPSVRFKPFGWPALPPAERHQVAAFDNVASAARRDILIRLPFAASLFGEDIAWGLGVLEAGYGLAYAPKAAVIHSHPRSARSLYRRNYLSHHLLFRLFGLRAIPDMAHWLRAAVATATFDARIVWRAGLPRRVPATILESVASTLGQYHGARDSARGAKRRPGRQ
jgi:rhamnosyltransferase